MPTPFTGSSASDVPFLGDPSLVGLLLGDKWGGPVGAGVTVSFSFPESSGTSVWSLYPADPLGYEFGNPEWDNPFVGYHGLNAAQQTAVRDSLLAWSHVADISFVEVADTPTEVGDIRVAFTSGGNIFDAYAYAYGPAPFAAYAGDVWLNSVQPVESGNDYSSGANGFNTVIHELGHAIGLDHPFSVDDFPAAFDSYKYTVMSYSDAPGHQDTGESSFYPTTPMLLDIVALQHIYGVNTTWHAGDDTYAFNEGSNYYQTIWDAGGNDTIQYVSAVDGARIDLRAGNFSQLGNPITLSNGVIQQDNVAIAFDVVFENAIGGGGNDVLIGNSVANSLTGGAGNDSLDGGGGNDSLIGGAGNDSYTVDSAGDVVTENLNEGTDAVQSSVSYTLAENQENLTLTGSSHISGIGNDLGNVITGNTGNNILNGMEGTDTLVGGLGNDSLDGWSGVDSLAGGAGNDLYVVDVYGDVVTENAAQGTDTVWSAISWTLGANVENLELKGTGNLNGTGNGLNNSIIGNADDNVLDGGAGNDILTGGDGNDSYVVDAAGDSAVESSALGGTDRVFSSVSFILGANLENLTLTGGGAINGTGNALVNELTGNSGANLLDGLGGADALAGGQGNDTYIVNDAGDAITENLNEGADAVQSSVGYTLAANLENLTLTGASDVFGVGNDLNNVVTGNPGHNILNGMEGADTLIGGLGNDSLDGWSGTDSLSGGAGDDLYVVDVSGDVVTESAAQGNDTVWTAITWTLGANVENLELKGVGNLNGTGNGLNNAIIGNADDNVLDGGAGNDTLTGSDGNDTYVVDAAGDSVMETSALGGTDRVFSSVSFILGANLENLTLTGGAAINGTGNSLGNELTGNGGANMLDGQAGADTLAGGAGNDTYVIDGGDTLIEIDGQGVDTIQAGFSYSLADPFENLVLTGTGDFNATGNAADNAITGNSGNNVLNGGGGNDVMTGGGGDDTYFVIETGDVVIEVVGGGTDTVNSSRDISLSGTAAGIENLTLLSGSEAISAIGNSLNNELTGNAANNILSGGDGNDVLRGGQGYDLMTGGAGNDTYYVNRGDGAGTSKLAPFEDQVVEALNGGTDTVFSSMYTYTLDANVENLVLAGVGRKGFGNALNNAMTGDALNNTLDGGAGNDTLDGGAGVDRLTGGAGTDSFVFSNLGSVDRVLDFNVADDTIQLSLAVFDDIGTAGAAMTEEAFALGPTALEADDRILYDTNTGALYYDADGDGVVSAPVQFALLSGAPALTFADIAVIA